MTTITRERLLEIIEDGFLKHGESKGLARIALSSLEAGPVVTNYWMPAVGEYCEVKSEQFADFDWVKIKVVAVHNGRVAAIVCCPDAHDYGHLEIFGWEYDRSVFRPEMRRVVR